MDKAILSREQKPIGEALRKLGYKTINSESVDVFIWYEREHADLQCLIIDDTAFVASRCMRLADDLRGSYKVILCADGLGHDYPSNVALSAVVTGKTIICRAASLDRQVMTYCRDHGYEIINVRQGYTKCSCAVAGENAVITADRGIFNSLKETNIDVLMIRQGRVKLEGAEYGFIGGASGYDKDRKTLYFCGDLSTHPDHRIIRQFCKKHGTEIVSLTRGYLIDIGGIILC